MESIIIETRGCPLDFNLSQSWKQDSSHTHTSDYSESADEETEIKLEEDLIAQIKNLSFANTSDSKYITPKCSNETSDINSQEKDASSDYSESTDEEPDTKHDDDLIEQIKNLSFVNASDLEYITPKYSNKASKISSKEKDSSGECILMENKEIEELRSSSSSLRYKEPLKFIEENDVKSTFCKCPNKNCEIYSRKKNNKENLSFVEMENQFSSLSLNKYSESGSDNSGEEESDSDDDEKVESVILRERDPTRHNRPGNNKPQRTAPFTRNRTKTSKPHFNLNHFQKVGNFSPPVSNGFNTYPDNHININDLERYGRFPGYAATNVQKESSLNTCLENLTVEEVGNLLSSQNPVDLFYPLPLLSNEDLDNVFNNSSTLNQNMRMESNVKKISYPDNNQYNLHSEHDHGLFSYSKENVGDSTSDDLSTQNPLDLLCSLPPLSNEDLENVFRDSSSPNQNINVESTVQKISYPNSNQHNFHPEPDHKHYRFSKANVGESGYYSNSVYKNISSINWESSSPETSDSKEMEDEFKRILSNDSKRKNKNQTCKTSYKTKESKIYTVYGTAARDMLFNSPTFCKRAWKRENEEIRNQIKKGELGTEEKMVIHIIKINRTTKYRGTNLHYAIREENIEKVFCLVECHKEFHGGLSEINIRDNSDKTVLDYSKEKGLDLLTAYLEENTAKSYSDICN